MMTKPSEDIEERAAAWLAREDRNLSITEASDLAVWLEASTANKIAYLRLQTTWRRADRLALHVSQHATKTLPPHYRRTIYRLAAGILFLLMTGAGLFYLQVPSHQTYTTEIGQQKTVQLSDGTRVQLNTNTRLQSRMNTAQRTVTLVQGEAYFEISHNAVRPFVVYAGGRKITDIGTKFAVRSEGDRVEVVVTEGCVRLDEPSTATTRKTFTDVPAGSMAYTRGGETLVVQKKSQMLADMLSWRHGMLMFHQVPLETAVAEFNRYSKRHITVEGSAKKIRIGGSFRSDNISGFLSLIHDGFGLSITTQDDKVVISDH